MATSLTSADVEKVEASVTTLCDKWEELEKEGSEYLKEICGARVQLIHPKGSLFGLEELDAKIGIREAIVAKINQKQKLNLKELTGVLELMATAITSFLNTIDALLSSYLPTKPVLHLQHLSSQVVEKFTNDLATKETITNTVALDGPIDAGRLQIQMYAFTCQGYILDSIDTLKERIRATAASL